MRATRRSRSRTNGSGRHWQALLLAGLVLVALVGPFAAGPTAAFTSATFDRGSTVGVTDDADGLLGLDVASSVTAGGSSRLVTVTNRLDRTVTVAVSLDTTAGSLSNAGATLAPGETLTTSVSVSCDEAPASLPFTVESSAGSQFTGTASRSTTVDTADCSSDSAPIEFVPGSATPGSFSGPGGGSTGSLALTVKNTESTARTITGFELREAGSATALSFDGPPPVNVEPGKDEVYIDATGGSTDSEGAAESSRGDPAYDVGTGTMYPFDRSVTIDAGETARVSLYQFVSNGQPYGVTSGDRVELTLSFQDGSQTTVSFTV
ncbi:hypothetical protein [Halorientalis salina]|uniref:hypothetical protein n=1 Tax=Halorientalis salina TaxID=2932266 RepID=UPI0010AD0008|nr:hypothetical protein [Halorientalis salina]